MLINIQSTANKDFPQKVILNLSTRLPSHVVSPCKIECAFFIEPLENYSLLHRVVKAKLELLCQRCLHSFNYDYAETIILALCPSEALATKLSYAYESMVVENNMLDLLDLVTDDLYLLTPQMHQNLDDCEKSVAQFISGLC